MRNIRYNWLYCLGYKTIGGANYKSYTGKNWTVLKMAKDISRYVRKVKYVKMRSPDNYEMVMEIEKLNLREEK